MVKRMVKFLISATLAGVMFGVLLVPAFAFNILGNPGFETGSLPPWVISVTCGGVSGCEDWNVTSADRHSGSFSATEVSNLVEDRFGDGPTLKQTFSSPVAPSSIHQVSFWNRYPDASQTQVTLDFFYSNNTSQAFGGSNTTTDWTFHDFTTDLASAPPNTDLVAIAISPVGDLLNQSTNRRMYLDDVIVDAAVPEPGSLALFATGFFGLGGFQILRRRR